MRIEVVRSGGFTAVPRQAAVETADHPDGARLAALAEAALASPAAPDAPAAPDGFRYTVTAGGRTLHCAEPHLTPQQRELIRRVLGEGA
jgi:hypothetical protein